MLRIFHFFCAFVQAQPPPPREHCGYEACHPTREGVINVHLVPHSHDDTGWLKTVDQYYYGSNNSIQEAGVGYIIDTVVTELQKNPERKFVFVEIAFFAMWWEEADDHLKEVTRRLVNTGQLEFLLGGWCMNDEGASHYTAMLEQNGFGLQWLQREFGECGRPHGAWQIDPFGHSRTQAELFSLMGYDSVYFARMDYQEYAHRNATGTIEMIWRGNPDYPAARDLFTGGLFDTTYGPPKGFQWSHGFGDDPIIDDHQSEEYNVDARVDDFMKQVERYAASMAKGHVMMAMGSDFNYANALMAYKNMDKLIYHTNRLYGHKVHVMYSTPACYTMARNKAQMEWSVKTDDFMPYSNGPNGQYWSGYFTSRPGFKGYVWDTNPVLQMCHHVNLRNHQHGNNHMGDEAEYRMGAAFGVGQHHDGISGTEKQHVVDDYTKQLYRGRKGCDQLADVVFHDLYQTPLGAEKCEYLNISVCDASGKDSFSVGIYSPSSHPEVHPIRIPVNGTSFNVWRSDDIPIDYDVVPVSDNTKNIRRDRGDLTNELWFLAETKPMDLVTYWITARSDDEVLEANVDEQVISNEVYNVTFGEAGLEMINGLKVANSLMFFNSSQGYGQNSGAYIFRPNKTDPEMINAKPTVSIVKGKTVEQATVTWGAWASQVYRLWKGANSIEVEWSVGPIPVNNTCEWNPKGCLWGKEVISRYDADIDSADNNNRAVCWTDSSGRNTLKRTKDFRPSFDLNTTDAETGVAGNYYPINSRISVKDEKHEFTILIDRAQAGGSMNPGSLDLMVHRRITVDDGRGVGEPLMEPGQFGDGLMVRGKHWLLLDQKIVKPVEEAILMKPQIFIWNSSVTTKSNSLLMNPIDPSIKIITLQKHHVHYNERDSILLRVEHIYQKSENAQPVDLHLDHLVNQFHAMSAHEFYAGGDMDTEQFHRMTWKTKEQKQTPKIPPSETACSLKDLCLTVNPGDLKTVVLTGRFSAQ